MQASCSVFRGSRLRRTALDDVGNVDVLMPVQVDELQHVVQQLAPPAHKGLALKVLVLAGALTDEHDLGVPGAYAEHHIGAFIRQGALLTGEALGLQLVPIQHHEKPHSK